MPVVGENRELIKKGLEILNTNPRPGFRSLLQEVGIKPGTVTSSTIGYTLAPRLNAAGRMGQSEVSVNLLLSDNYEESENFASVLCSLNSQRRQLEQEIYDEAILMLPDEVPNKPIVLASRGWYQGVTGIIAAKMAERFRLPVIIISIDDDGTGRGSCRSFGSFVLYDALCECEDILSNYGGHEKAAGITVAEENIEEFRRRLINYYNSKTADLSEPGLKLDFEVEKPEILSIKNIESLMSLEPFGSGNPSPCLCIQDVVLTSMQSIGDGKHTRLRIEKSGIPFDCIFFSVAADELDVSEGMTVDIAFEPQINEYRGRSSVQLQLFDIKPSEK